MRNILYALFIVLSIIGAGFASGEEIRIFFGEFNWLSGFKIAFFAIVLFFILRFFLLIKQKEKLNAKPSIIYTLLSLICYLSVAGTMVSALTAITGNVAAFILAGICVLIAFFGFKYISKIFDYLSVVLVLGLLFAIIVLFINKESAGVSKPIDYTLPSLTLSGFNISMYVLCNIFLTSELIFKISNGLSKKDIFKVTAISTSVLTVLLILISILISGTDAQMPLLSMAKGISQVFHWFYLVLLCVAILSTLLTVLYGIKQSANKLSINYFIIVPVVFVLGLFNFSTLVQYLTIIEGCLCLGFIIYNFFQNVISLRS